MSTDYTRMLPDDLLVTKRSFREIENTSLAVKKLLGIEPDEKVDLSSVVEIILPQFFPQYSYVVLEDQELSFDPARMKYSPAPMLEVGHSTHTGLSRDDPSARFQVSHELGHFFLHEPALTKSLKNSNQERKLIRDMSGEGQADDFALCFLVSRRNAAMIRNPIGICESLGVPYELAVQALRKYSIPYTKLEPYQMINLISEYPKYFAHSLRE